MKRISACVILLTFLGCTHSRMPKVDLTPASAEIRREVEEFTNQSHGTVRVERVYRGDMLILTSMTSDKMRTRTFHFQGGDCLIESDEDLNGSYETIGVFGDVMYQFDEFRRTPEGDVQPISEDEYLEKKRKIYQATTNMWQIFDDAMHEKRTVPTNASRTFSPPGEKS